MFFLKTVTHVLLGDVFLEHGDLEGLQHGHVEDGGARDCVGEELGVPIHPAQVQ